MKTGISPLRSKDAAPLWCAARACRAHPCDVKPSRGPPRCRVTRPCFFFAPACCSSDTFPRCPRWRSPLNGRTKIYIRERPRFINALDHHTYQGNSIPYVLFYTLQNNSTKGNMSKFDEFWSSKDEQIMNYMHQVLTLKRISGEVRWHIQSRHCHLTKHFHTKQSLHSEDTTACLLASLAYSMMTPNLIVANFSFIGCLVVPHKKTHRNLSTLRANWPRMQAGRAS